MKHPPSKVQASQQLPAHVLSHLVCAVTSGVYFQYTKALQLKPDIPFDVLSAACVSLSLSISEHSA